MFIVSKLCVRQDLNLSVECFDESQVHIMKILLVGININVMEINISRLIGINYLRGA